MILGIVLLFGAGLYQAAQKRRLRKGLLSPRRDSAVISVGLGVAYPLLVTAFGWALSGDLAGLGLLALVCLLPWVLSRAQWKSNGERTSRTTTNGRRG
jgi:hypothetical protein